MTHTADLFWSFRSPYSYLATGRYVALTQEYDLGINLRPVYSLEIRAPDFFERNHPNWLGYVVRDILRLGQYLDIPIAPPDPDPIIQDMVTRKIAEDQPYIHHLTRLGQAAARAGKGLVFARKVSRLIWGSVKGWNDGDHLTEAQHVPDWILPDSTDM